MRTRKQIQLAGQLKHPDDVNADDAQSMFVLIYEKVKETRLNFSNKIVCNSLIKGSKFMKKRELNEQKYDWNNIKNN